MRVQPRTLVQAPSSAYVQRCTLATAHTCKAVCVHARACNPRCLQPCVQLCMCAARRAHNRACVQTVHLCSCARVKPHRHVQQCTCAIMYTLLVCNGVCASTHACATVWGCTHACTCLCMHATLHVRDHARRCNGACVEPCTPVQLRATRHLHNSTLVQPCTERTCNRTRVCKACTHVHTCPHTRGSITRNRALPCVQPRVRAIRHACNHTHPRNRAHARNLTLNPRACKSATVRVPPAPDPPPNPYLGPAPPGWAGWGRVPPTPGWVVVPQ